MAKGVLGIIICPMLEDELIYKLSNDSDIGRIVLLQNEYCQSIHDKLKSHDIPFEFVPESEFDSGKMVFDKGIYNIVIKADDLALHAEPVKLKSFIEKQVVDIQPLVDAVALYYGMCGNYGWDMTKWCKENGYKPCSMFRGNDGLVCDDCVSVAIGGSTKSKALLKAYTGMFFITPAIAYNWQVFLGAGDLAKEMSNIPKDTLEELGIFNQDDYMRWMFEIGHYTNSLVIDTGLGDTPAFLKKAQEVSEKVNLKPITIADGWVSLDCANNVYDEGKGYLS